jgi:hypothetical protein
MMVRRVLSLLYATFFPLKKCNKIRDRTTARTRVTGKSLQQGFTRKKTQGRQQQHFLSWV